MASKEDALQSKCIGILPAAGIGSRLRPFRYPKELLPITYENLQRPYQGLRPRVVSEFALETFIRAGVKECVLVVAPWKLELINYFGDGSNFGINLAYVCQEEARGLPAAIDLAYPWLRDDYVAFAMPDTIVWPSDCVKILKELAMSSDADLVLGVFPTPDAARLGPVIFGGTTAVKVFDKCDIPPAMNTWGVAVWGPRFSDMLHSELAELGRTDAEPVLGEFFDLAIRRRMRVRAVHFDAGEFIDVGTTQGIRQCLDLPHNRHASE